MCKVFSGGREGRREASPSLVYGAALLMRLGVTPPPGFKSRSLRKGPTLGWDPTIEQAPVAQRIEHLTTDQKVWGSNPYGRTSGRDSRNPQLPGGFLLSDGAVRVT